ncbi:MAG: carboxylate--amine ligase [Candidatus Njordarchaeales archaeon]
MKIEDLREEDLQGIKILVLDSSERSALATIRSLGARGAHIIAADFYRYALGFFSKYVNERVIYPSPIRNLHEFIRWLERYVMRERIDIILSFADHTTAALSMFKEKIEKYTLVGTPHWDVFIKTFDKMYTLMEAEKAGVPFPKTWVITELEELKKIAEKITYPVVIKPRRKVVWINGRGVFLKVTARNYARDPSDLVRKYSLILRENPSLVRKGLFPLIQTYVSGIGVGFEALISRGKNLLAFFMHRRIHEYPVTGGASTLRISIYDEKLFSHGSKILRRIGWDGVAMVEFKLSNDKLYLMEINGRFWGSLPLAISSGVDFPYLYTMYLLGRLRSIPKCFRYKMGVLQKWSIPGEFLWLFGMLSRSFQRRNYKELFPIIKEFIAYWTASQDDIIVAEDAKPLLGALLMSLKYFWEVIKGERTLSGELTEKAKT